MEITYFVYMLLDPRYEPAIPFYVGISYKNKRRYRPKEHILEAKKKNSKDGNILKLSIIRKILELNKEPIIQELFETDSKKDVIKKEIEIISLYGRRDNNTGILTNLTDGGEGNSLGMSQITKNKISESHKGKHLSEEHKEKLKIAFTGNKNHFYGKMHTEENRGKIKYERAKQVIKPHTEETKEIIRQANIGRIFSEETKQKMRLAKLQNNQNIEKARLIAIEKSKQKKVKRIMEYNSNPKLCLQCDTPIEYRKKLKSKFCCQQCYCIHQKHIQQ